MLDVAGLAPGRENVHYRDVALAEIGIREARLFIVEAGQVERRGRLTDQRRGQASRVSRVEPEIEQRRQAEEYDQRQYREREAPQVRDRPARRRQAQDGFCRRQSVGGGRGSVAHVSPPSTASARAPPSARNFAPSAR